MKSRPSFLARSDSAANPSAGAALFLSAEIMQISSLTTSHWQNSVSSCARGMLGGNLSAAALPRHALHWRVSFLETLTPFLELYYVHREITAEQEFSGTNNMLQQD